MLSRCEQRIGYQFKDKALLWSALIHASGADHRLASNERLEFLGDAILGAIVCEMLYHRYPDYLEGELTRIKSVVVSRRTCAKVSRAMELDEFLIVGKGMETNASVPKSLLADVFESLVAAIHLDGGSEQARLFIESTLRPEIESVVTGASGENHKSQLQQLAQREFGNTPTYRLLEQKGPDHSKCFRVAAQIGTRAFEPAWGPNKKEAEQRAARNALAALAEKASSSSSD
jgi:ribonuclease-3